MSKGGMNDLLKSRMKATQQATELEVGNAAFETIFRAPADMGQPVVRKLPINKLRPFFTANIGFKPYSQAKLQVLADHMGAEGQLERIIVRSISDTDEFEILAGHNRTSAAKLNNWECLDAEIVDADDERATTIAVSTNLLRRQDLTIIERGQAYKALLEAQRKQGFRSDLQTSGENRQKFLAREVVATFFGVTEYEMRKAIKLTQLIPVLQEILESKPKHLNLACADLIADYDATSQEAFTEMCNIEGYQLNKATVKYIVSQCPPPRAEKQAIFAAWRQARATAEKRLAAPSKKIVFDRKRFSFYLEKLGSEEKLEEMFLLFLKERMSEKHE